MNQFLYFCECRYSSESAKGTGSHKRYCNGEPPVEHQHQFKCDYCKFSSQTENGVVVHKSVAHKEEYNNELSAKEKNLKWTEQEFEYSNIQYSREAGIRISSTAEKLLQSCLMENNVRDKSETHTGYSFWTNMTLGSYLK